MTAPPLTSGRAPRHRGTRRLVVGASVAAVAVLAAACGSSSASGTSTTTTRAASSGGASGPSSATVRLTHVAGVGTVLVDGAGRTLYLFVPDHQGASTCTGACAQAWPPLTASGQPTAGPGVQASMLGTVTDADGTVQVTYNHWPLYTFVGDTGNGEAKGQGLGTFGGKWWVLGSSGNAVEAAVASSGASPTTTKAASGGYGY